MILVDTLEDLVHNYLDDRARPGSAVGTVNAHDLAGHIAAHLAERGVDTGYADGSRLALPGTTPQPSEPERRRLPLVLQDHEDDHVRIYCDGRDCYWSWSLYQDATSHTNAGSIMSAVRHALCRHGHT
ncbi:hypothetical protein [Actinocrispum wychmicini]|uniref:Uncharacterized protein n=1 Tax=Actinocrispum wychmicini TaxID=1213861 RepID=A0A4R2IXM5_9PSEU|nr:hypothetical protein [Actinocrispum wychmicini]TCO49662.1 hypothetical protein EV192_11427 [Actinocrispum wychmicini]